MRKVVKRKIMEKVMGKVKVTLIRVMEWNERRAGVGYRDDIYVTFSLAGESTTSTKGWWWHNRFSAADDKPWLKVDSIGAVEVSERGKKTEVEVELINENYGNRTITFTFPPELAWKYPLLTW